MNRRIIGDTYEDMQFYIIPDTGRWLVGAGGHSDSRSIDIHVGAGGNPYQAQLMVSNLVVMLI